MPRPAISSGIEARNGVFATTHWSVILAAQGCNSAAASEALEKLCQTYWLPLYVFIRQEGHSPDEALDLTQEFFARFLERNDLKAVKREKGKFRSFLLAAAKHFLANSWDSKRRVK